MTQGGNWVEAVGIEGGISRVISQKTGKGKVIDLI